DAGALLELGAAGAPMESWMHIEVDRIPTEAARAELEETLRSVLADVHRAVGDWPDMRHMCLDIVADLQSAPPSTPDPATIAPTIDFLTWLAHDHFTFLGYREYALE